MQLKILEPIDQMTVSMIPLTEHCGYDDVNNHWLLDIIILNHMQNLKHSEQEIA